MCVKLINNNINIIETINGDEEILYSLDLNNGKDINEVDIKESDSKKIEININDNKLNLTLDGKIIVEGLEVKNTNKGGIYLEATWGEYGYSQRNIADDVYDGVFKKFKVSEINDTILYDSSLKGFDLIRYNIRNYFNKVINWFIKYL